MTTAFNLVDNSFYMMTTNSLTIFSFSSMLFFNYSTSFCISFCFFSFYTIVYSYFSFSLVGNSIFYNILCTAILYISISSLLYNNYLGFYLMSMAWSKSFPLMSDISLVILSIFFSMNST